MADLAQVKPAVEEARQGKIRKFVDNRKFLRNLPTVNH